MKYRTRLYDGNTAGYSRIIEQSSRGLINLCVGQDPDGDHGEGEVEVRDIIQVCRWSASLHEEHITWLEVGGVEVPV